MLTVHHVSVLPAGDSLASRRLRSLPLSLLSHACTNVRVSLAYSTAVLGGLAFYSTIPLFFELTLETIYGWANETAASTALMLVNGLCQVLFLAAPTHLSGSAGWMPWLTAAMCAASLALVASMRVEYRRLRVDLGEMKVASPFDASGCI